MTYEQAEAEAWRRASAREAAAAWELDESFTVWPCGEDHPGEIALLVLPID